MPRRPAPWAPLVAVTLGLVLIAMATPRLIAGFLVEPYDVVLRDLAKGRQADGALLVAGITDYGDALDWHDEANNAAELATFNYVLAESFGFRTDPGVIYLERALAATRRAVAGNPAQPYAWLQMAIALEALEGTSARSVGALVESLRRASYQPRMAVLRSVLVLRAWPLLDAEARSLGGEQILLAARVNPAALATAVPSPSLWRVVQDVLVADPALLQAVTAARPAN